MANPRDWLEDDYNPVKKKYNPRDFLEPEEPEESFSEAVKYVPSRVAEDFFNAGKNVTENIPEYWGKGLKEVPAYLNPLTAIQHPITRSKNVIAGLAELGHNTINTPYNLTNYLENRLKLLPKGAADKVKKYLYQEDISGALDQFTGKEMNPGDALTRGIVRNAANIIPTTKVAGSLNPLNFTAKNIAKDVLRAREKNIGHYGNRYENLWKEAEGKGFGDALYNIDIDMPIIKKYSPNKGIKGLEDFDKNPTLQNAHNAKSDLLRIKRDLDKLTTLRTAERQQLGAVNNAIDSINKNMFKGPDGKIHEGMKQKYSDLQEGYRNEVVPYKNKAINEFMRGESSADELVNSLSRKAFYAKRGKYHNAMRMRKLVKSHPYLAGIGTGSALGAGALSFYDELFGKNK